jgi:hypothetical protein
MRRMSPTAKVKDLLSSIILCLLDGDGQWYSLAGIVVELVIKRLRQREVHEVRGGGKSFEEGASGETLVRLLLVWEEGSRATRTKSGKGVSLALKYYVWIRTK